MTPLAGAGQRGPQGIAKTLPGRYAPRSRLFAMTMRWISDVPS
jgi:hypothetical protein